MSRKSKSGPASKEPAIDRPFAPGVLAEARRIAEQYQVVVHFTEGEWYGHGLELPMSMDDGTTVEECVSKTREAMVATVASLLEDGRKPPAPAAAAERTEQINIRLTLDEKRLIEDQASKGGYRGLSDYVRAKAVAG